MWLDPSFIRCRRGARNGTSGPWNGQRACAAKRCGRLQVDEVHSPRLPRRYRQGASPKWLLLRCQAGASLTSHASTGGGEGALAMTSSVVKVSEDGQSTWACQASEAQSMIRSVHPSGNRAALRHTRRYWPLPSGSNAGSKSLPGTLVWGGFIRPPCPLLVPPRSLSDIRLKQTTFSSPLATTACMGRVHG